MTLIEVAQHIIDQKGKCGDINCRECPFSETWICEHSNSDYDVESEFVVNLAKNYLLINGVQPKIEMDFFHTDGNAMVWIKPTSSGWKQINEYNEKFGKAAYVHCPDEDGYINGQFWYIMGYFKWGITCCGNELPFEDMKFEKKD